MSLLAVAATLAVPPVANAGAASEGPSPHGAKAGLTTPLATDPYCRVSRRAELRAQTDISSVASGILIVDGVRLEFRQSSWQARTPAKPTVSQYFHAAAWLVSVYRADPALAVSLLLEQAVASPDVGGLAPVEQQLRTGWTESHVTRRTWTALCLYSRTRDERILPVLDALIAANLDPQRYAGPPRRTAHNHAVFANEVLRRAGELLQRSDLVATSRERLDGAFDSAFDSCGMTREQSSAYHALNLRIWSRNLPSPSSPRWLEILDAARRALGAIARPDAVLETIGDGTGSSWTAPQLDEIDVVPSGTIFCPETGWAAAHLSLPDGSRQHYTLRFGPARKMHGHQDHRAPTWWVGNSDGSGVPVLVDRGLFGKERNARYRWAVSQAAHSVARVTGTPVVGVTSGVHLDNPDADSYLLQTTQVSGTLARTLSIAHDAAILAVEDRFVSSSAVRPWFIQGWQLAPDWVRSEEHTAVTADGRHTLDVFCRRGPSVTKPQVLDVQHFPSYGESVPALELRCASADVSRSRIQTALVVDMARGTRDPARTSAQIVDGRLRISTPRGTYLVSEDGLLHRR